MIGAGDPADAGDPIPCLHCGDVIQTDVHECMACGRAEGTPFPCGDDGCVPCAERLACAARTGVPCPGSCGCECRVAGTFSPTDPTGLPITGANGYHANGTDWRCECGALLSEHTEPSAAFGMAAPKCPVEPGDDLTAACDVEAELGMGSDTADYDANDP